MSGQGSVAERSFTRAEVVIATFIISIDGVSPIPRPAPHKRDAGFTLVEVLIAMALLCVGLLGVAGALAVQSGGVAVSFPAGQGAVERGYYVSMATTLAQERLEQLKRLEYSLGTPVDEIGAPIPAGFADEPTIAGYPAFSREVRVQNGVPAANMKLITVTVRFAVPTEAGMVRESIALRTTVAGRP